MDILASGDVHTADDGDNETDVEDEEEVEDVETIQRQIEDAARGKIIENIEKVGIRFVIGNHMDPG